MKLIPILLMCFAFIHAEEGKISPEIFIFGKSYHSNRDVDWNETNPGLGLGLSGTVSKNFDMAIMAGAYKDSYGETAKFAVAGPRYYFYGDRDAFNMNVGLHIGYLHGSGINGVMAIPVIGIGYDRVTLCFTGVINNNSENTGSRDPKKNRGTESSVIAGFIKIRL